MAEAARKIRYSNYGSIAYNSMYDGNAIRVPGGAEVVRPRILPREQAAARPKVRLRSAGQVSVFAVVGFLASAALAVMVLLSYVQLTSLSDQVINLRAEYSALKEEEARLLTQYEQVFDLKSIEAAVTAEGNMVKLHSSQIHYMDLSGSDSVVVYEQETAADALKDTVKSLLGGIGEYLS